MTVSIFHRIVRDEALHGALVLALLVCVFLGTPLARYGEVYYSSADLTQDFSLTKIVPGHPSSNKLMSDAVTEMQPWLAFNRDELRAGRVPLWNPYNGAGCPHFANYQSAVFSIFSVPFYVMSMRAALVASAFLKLFALGFFTFLFLKEIRLKQVPALVGATAFMFSGHNVLLLSFPHVGALFALPAGLFFAERVFRRVEAAYPDGASQSPPFRPSIRAPLAGLTLSLVIGLLAGNPEPFYFALAFVCLYITARLCMLWSKLGADRASTALVASLGAKLAVAGLLAAGLTAFQTLPFLEYLQNSRVLEQRSFKQTPLETTFWPLLMFPNILGNPSTRYVLSYGVPPPNFEHVNTSYIGGTVLFLAVVSLAFARRDRYVAFFALAGAAWWFYAHDLFDSWVIFSKIPTLDMLPMNRSQGIWHLCTSVCAALALNHLWTRESPRPAWEHALVTFIVGFAALTACLIGADRLVQEYATFESPNHPLFPDHVPPHIHSISTSFAISVACACILWLARPRAARAVVCSILLIVVFLQTGYLFKEYNPVTENRFFFPVTPSVAALQKAVGKEQLAILGEDSLPPSSNLMYGVSSIANYDGLWVRDFDFLYRDTFGDGNNWRPVLKATTRGLKVFGVQYVLAKWDWLFMDAGLTNFPKAAGQDYIPHPILPNESVSQTFLSHLPRLQAVSVYLSTYPNGEPCTVDFKLEEVDTGRVIHQQRMSSVEIQADIFKAKQLVFPYEVRVHPNGRMVSFTFEPVEDSLEKLYRFTLSSLDSDPESVVIAWSTPLWGYGEGRAHWRGAQLPGELLFDFYFNWDAYERVAKIGNYGLFRPKKALPKYHVVGGAVIAESNEEALGLLRVPTFDPDRLVVLSDVPIGEASTAMGPRDNSKARLVQFPGSVNVYLVDSTRKALVHIEDEVTFLANKFKWSQIEHLTTAEFEGYTFIERDLDAQRAHGLRVVSPEAPDSVQRVIEETPLRAKIEVDRAEPGYLVIAQTHYPGWKATINGEEVPVHRANYAFSAVEVGRGRSMIELTFDPDSLRLGIWIGIASALGAAGALWLSRKPGAPATKRVAS